MYPQDGIDKFNEKLNELEDNTYVIEEEVNLVNGLYEDYLQHDNVSISSINVYTGSKLTGDKITNFIVSTPSTTPWKKSIKIFSNVSPVYISYETTGDTVEAEDINNLQDSIINIETEVERYKGANDTRILSDETRITNAENNKAEITYVNTELNKRYLKTETYSKDETDQRIQLVIDAAPAALDTLKEIADALNDDPNFATTITTQLAGKVDKITGKQLSTEDYSTTEKNKLAGIQDNANNYIHPATHPGSMIVEDSMHRFTNDTDKSKLDGISANAKNVSSSTNNGNIKIDNTETNVYTHPGSGTNPHGTTKSDVNLGNVTNDAQVKRTELGVASGVATLDSLGVNVQPPKSHIHDDRYYTETEVDNTFVKKVDLGDAGYGDMSKADYDKDNDGIVDYAEQLKIPDTRNIATTPDDYKQKVLIQLKASSVVGLTGGTYCTILGLRGWADDSGGVAYEVGFQTDGVIKVRTGTTASGWGAWKTLKGSLCWNDLKGV